MTSKRNAPHFNPQGKTTGPNNSNVLAGCVFSILYEKRNTAFICGKVSVILSVLQVASTVEWR